MRFYRLLLRLFPSAFRAEYGEEMCADFARGRRAWPALLLDVLTNAAASHWDLLRQDLRYTARTLRRTPGFTVTAIAVSALGIGATTAAFTLADHVLLRPLPFADADRLVKLWEYPPGYSRMEVSPPTYRDWRKMTNSFEAMAAYTGRSVNLVSASEPQRIEVVLADLALFPLLGVQPVLGRRFASEDGLQGAPQPLLLSYWLWQSAFGADPNVIGKKALLDGAPFEVIGVMPAEFRFPWRDAAAWTPMRFGSADFDDRGNNELEVIARLKPGVSLAQARTEMRAVAAQLARAYPKQLGQTSAAVYQLRDELSQRSRLLLIALLGAAACVLLIACSNLANLLLVRAHARYKELAVRTSLGAGRERLVRQLITESLTLAALGGALGVLLAHAGLPLLAKLVPDFLPVAATPAVDLRVLLFAALLTALTGLAFGVIPALRASGPAAAEGLREGARAGAGPRQERLRSLLVTLEVTVSVALLACAGLLFQALLRIQGVDPGFDSSSLLTLRTPLPMPRYANTAPRAQFYQRVLEEIGKLPGVSHAAFSSGLPMVMRGGIWPVILPGISEERNAAHTASLRFVTPRFFDTMGIPLRLGRDLRDADDAGAPMVAVVSESLARRYWPGEDPLGRRFKFAFQERTVVGVVGDIRVRGLERSSEPQVYLPYQQVPDGGLLGYVPNALVIRSASDPLALFPAVRRIIAAADAELPITNVQRFEDIVAADTAPRRVQLRVIAMFAAMAMLLAGIGIHGLLAFVVAQRAREFGVRMALGARPGDILDIVLRRTALLGGVGLFLGCGLAYLAGRSLEALLAGVLPWDVPTFLTAVALAVVMMLFGSLAPALRAVRLDPAAVMRVE
jgi:putative ABC transport system permease protein